MLSSSSSSELLVKIPSIVVPCRFVYQLPNDEVAFINKRFFFISFLQDSLEQFIVVSSFEKKRA